MAMGEIDAILWVVQVSMKRLFFFFPFPIQPEGANLVLVYPRFHGLMTPVTDDAKRSERPD